MSFCIHCGKELKDSSKFCHNCGKEIGNNPGDKEVKKSDEVVAQDNAKGYLNNPIQISPEERAYIDSGSWGAAFTGIFYPIAMKVSGGTSVSYVLLFILSGITYGIAGIGLLIWQILYGKRWAWQYRKWKNFEEFKSTQNIWDKWGKGILIGYVSLIVLAIIFGSES